MATLTLPTNQASPVKNLQVSFDVDLMQSYASGRIVSAQQRMAVAQDNTGAPLLFTIDTDGAFCLVRQTSAAATGWQRIDLSGAIDTNQRAILFAVSQDQNGVLRLAVALGQAKAAPAKNLYITGDLRNDMSDDEWAKVAFVARPAAAPATAGAGSYKITQILLGTNDDQQGPPLALVAVETPDGAITRADHYQVNMAATDTSWSWRTYTMPENATSIQDMAVGTVQGNRGVYTLYLTGADQALSFTGLPDPKFPTKRFNRSFGLPGPLARIATLPGAAGSDLYAAGAGLYVYPASGMAPTQIWGSADIQDVQDIIALQDSANISVWMVTGSKTLYHVRKSRAAPTWNYPLPVQAHVSQVTALRDWTHLTSQFFLVRADNSLVYLYQDPETTLWNETEITLPDTGTVTPINCYVTHLNFATDDLQPLTGLNVSISASGWISAVINGQKYSLGEATPVTLHPDAMGNIAIISEVDTLGVPIFHITADGLDQVLDVNPAHKVTEGLQGIKSGSDLSGATLKNGQPLLTRPVDPQTLDSAAQAVQQLAQSAGTLPPGAAGPGHARPLAQAASLGRLNTSTLAGTGHAWAMTFAGRQALYVDGAAATQMHAAAAAAATDYFADLGDFMESAWNSLTNVASFAVAAIDEGLSFIVTTANKVFHFVLTVAREALDAINWVLEETLGINLDTIIDWLGFIFNWDDIKQMHAVIRNMANQVLNYGQAEAAYLQQTAANFFENLKTQIQSLKPLPSGDPANQDARSGTRQNRVQQAANAQVSSALSSPGANWTNYQVLHGGLLAATSDQAASVDLPDPLVTFLTDVMAPAIDKLVAGVNQLYQDLTALYNQDQLDFDHVLPILAADIATTFLDILEGLVTGLLKIVAQLIAVMQDMLNAPAEIPFVAELYRKISGAPLTILDAISLVIAIPTTIIYKIVTNRSPLADMSGDMSKATYQQLFGQPGGGGGAAAAPARRLAAPIAAEAAEADASEQAAGSNQPSPAPNQAPEDPAKQTRILYSYWGGLAAEIAFKINQLISILESDEPDVLPWNQVTTVGGKVKIGVQECLVLVQTAGSFPVGSDPELWVQIPIWIGRLLAGVMEPLAGGLARGAIIAGSGTATMLAEIVVFVLELQHVEGKELAVTIAKFIDNLLRWLSEEAEAAAFLVPDPESKATASALAALGWGAELLSLLVRLSAFEIPNVIEHQMY